MTKKYLWALIVIVIVIAVGFAFFKQPKDDTTVKIGYLPTATIAALPIWIVEQQNLFQKAGIKVEIVPFQSSNQALEAVVRNDVDLVPNISSIPVYVAQLIDPKGVRGFSIMNFTKDPGDAVITKIDSSIKTLKDLEGKKVAVFPGSTATNILKASLVKNSVDVSKVEIIPLSPQNYLQALEVGSVDALYSYEPNTSVAISKGIARKVSGSLYTENVPDSPFAVGIISEKFIEGHASLAKDVVEVFQKANDYALNNEVATKKLIAEKSNISEDATSLMSILPTRFGRAIDTQKNDEWLNWLISIGELKSKPDLSNFFYKP
jgi:ABC-type nitrate/sulfonate/bicarbonate transport system substrate-binding protein